MANSAKQTRAPQGNVSDYANRIVSAYVEGSTSVKLAEAAVIGARTSALDSLKAALAGFNGKVTQATWKADWSEPVKAAMLKAGMGEKTIPVRASELMVAVIALTGGIEPTEGVKSLQGFVKEARAVLQRAGTLKSTSKSGRSKPPVEPGERAFKSACKVVAGEGASRAQVEMVALIMGEHRDWFFKKASALIVALNDAD